jgi:pimeloyl-ACP methyl ester carboxylesterase
VKSAIFLAPSFEKGKSVTTWVMRSIFAVSAFILRAMPISEKPGKRIDYSPLIPTSDWDMRRIRIDVRNTNLAIYFFCLHSLYASFNDEFISQICMPVVIIHGRRDSIVPIKHSVWASDKIAGSKLVTLPLADHMLIFNYPG